MTPELSLVGVRVAPAQLKRSLTAPLLTLYGLGTILGAGIYVLIGKIAGIAGLYAPVAFVISAAIAGFTALSYAKLSARYPKSAGEAVYVSHAFSWPILSAAVGWSVITTGIVSAATMINGFAGYFSVFVDIQRELSITLVLAAVIFVACWGITQSTAIAATVTIIEVIGLLVVLFLLRAQLLSLPEHWMELIPPLNGQIWLGVMSGAFLAFYAFIGFEDMVNVAEEVINPERVLPVAIVASLLLATLIYVLVAIAAVLSMPTDALSATDSPMVALLADKYPRTSVAMAIVSLIAIINGILVQIIMGARMLYGLGCQKLAPTLFKKVSGITQTPVRATLMIGFVVWILATSLPLVLLAKITSFIILLIFALVNVSLIAINLRESKGIWKKTQVNFCPTMGAVFCVGLVVLQISKWL